MAPIERYDVVCIGCGCGSGLTAAYSAQQDGKSVALVDNRPDQGLDYVVARKEYADFAKGKIVGSPAGFAKLLVEKGSDRILGFHMIGPQAADLIHEVVVAMNTRGPRRNGCATASTCPRRSPSWSGWCSMPRRRSRSAPRVPAKCDEPTTRSSPSVL
ncbi:FAD-binding protein [Vreelandella nigrificans]|nr:FAD-binding protein [Halomonas nigrificans]